LNVPRTTVQRVYNRYMETGGYNRRPGSGRLRCTTAQDDQYIVVSALRNRRITSIEIKNNLQQFEVEVSDDTIRRGLAEENIQCRRPVLVPALKRGHREARLNFAIEHQNWDMHDWSRVLFTDESRFCLKVPDGRHRVYRRPGERFAPCTVKARENFYSGSIMVWAGISADAHTDLHFFERNMDSYIYIEDIIIPYIVPYKEFIGENFLLMQDNARPHVARVVTNFLNEINIERMVWPAIS
ncbi:Transposable element Tcb2 transposase, partial [Camponotus floridanus]